VDSLVEENLFHHIDLSRLIRQFLSYRLQRELLSAGEEHAREDVAVEEVLHRAEPDSAPGHEDADASIVYYPFLLVLVKQRPPF